MNKDDYFLNVKSKRTHKDCEYEVQAKVPLNKNCLVIQITSPIEASIWKAEFSSLYIEDLTEKTGQKKSFFEFLSLIDQCLQKKDGKYAYDVLTYSDLKQLNGQNDDAAKKKESAIPSSNQKVRESKRYLILSSGGVHYPLSLNGEIINDPNALREMIQHLRERLPPSSRGNQISTEEGDRSTFYSTNGFSGSQGQNSTNHSSSSEKGSSVNANKEMDQIKLENELLRAKVKRIEEYFSQKQGAVEIEQSIAQRFALENELDRLRLTHGKRIIELENELETKEQQLQNKKQEVVQLQRELTQSVCESEGVAGTRLRAQLMQITEETEQSVLALRKTILKQKADITKHKTEAERLLAEDKKLRTRIGHLEIELANAQKRSNSRSNPLSYLNNMNRSRSNSSYSSLNSRKTPSPGSKQNLPSRLGYSSPSLQNTFNSNRINQRINSKTPSPNNYGSKNSLATPNSSSSLRSSSNTTPIGTPSNRFQRSSSNTYNQQQSTDTRSNKFFSNNNNAIQRKQSYPSPQQQTNPGKPNIGSQSDQQNNKGMSIVIKNQLTAIDTIPEKGKYHSQHTTSPINNGQTAPLQQNKYYNNNFVGQRSNSGARDVNQNQAKSLNSTVRAGSNYSRNNVVPNKQSVPQTSGRAPLSQQVQPRVIANNNGYMKSTKSQVNAQPQKYYGIGDQSRQVRTELNEKIESGLFDDKHFKNIEAKSELDVKINKLQNILQSAKELSILEDI